MIPKDLALDLCSDCRTQALDIAVVTPPRVAVREATANPIIQAVFRFVAFPVGRTSTTFSGGSDTFMTVYQEVEDLKSKP